MTTPLFDAHGVTIQDPADGYHTPDEVNAFIDAVTNIPQGERNKWYAAIVVHWMHHHNASGGDHVMLRKARDGSLTFQTPPMNYAGMDGYDGLDIPQDTWETSGL